MEIAFAYFGVKLRHEGLGGAAIWQGDGFLYEPHDVAGELRDLCVCQGDAWGQLEGLGNGDTVVDEGLVLVVVILIATQEASSGELPDLVTNELLFVVVIAQSFLGNVGVVCARGA